MALTSMTHRRYRSFSCIFYCTCVKSVVILKLLRKGMTQVYVAAVEVEMVLLQRSAGSQIWQFFPLL